jgi:hypothetical protein
MIMKELKILHSLDRTVWDGNVEAILESEKYDTLTVNELFSNLKSAKLDRGMTARQESLTDSSSLALVGGKGAKSNANASSMMYSLSSLMTLPDEEFDMLGEDEMVLLTRRFERLHKNRVSTRKNPRTCFQCGKPGHFIADYPEKMENMDGYKDSYKHWSNKDDKYQARRDHKHKNKHKDERRSRKKDGRGRKARAMVRASNVDSKSAYSSSSSSSSEDEGDQGKNKKSSNNLSGLSCYPRDGFCSMGRSSSSKKSHQSDSNSNFEDEVRHELPFLCEDYERLGKLLDNRDDMLREAKKMRKELRTSLEDARNRVAELETQSLRSIRLKLHLWFLMRLTIVIALCT